MTVLVLGLGGNVSQGILKALALSDLRPRVVGACVSARSTGLYMSDIAYVSPRASEPGFVPWLFDLCAAEGVDAVLSGVEPVLEVLAANRSRLESETGAVAVVSSPEVLQIGTDKLTTARWLSQQGLNAPDSVSATDNEGIARLVDAHAFPLLAKPRRGKGGDGIVAVVDDRDLDWVRGREGYLIQEHLGDPTSEYTVGCFCDCNGRFRGSLAMSRELLDGTTISARVGEFPEVTAEARRITEALRPLGPANVQLRVNEERPVCFEINVRFSGTTPMRARLGFNEVDAAIRQFVLGEDARDLPSVTAGVALRYWNEIYVDPAAFEELEGSGRLEDPESGRREVEDLGMRP